MSTYTSCQCYGLALSTVELAMPYATLGGPHVHTVWRSPTHAHCTAVLHAQLTLNWKGEILFYKWGQGSKWTNEWNLRIFLLHTVYIETWHYITAACYYCQKCNNLVVCYIMFNNSSTVCPLSVLHYTHRAVYICCSQSTQGILANRNGLHHDNTWSPRSNNYWND
jgi:hypothetical protein